MCSVLNGCNFFHDAWLLKTSRLGLFCGNFDDEDYDDDDDDMLLKFKNSIRNSRACGTRTFIFL